MNCLTFYFDLGKVQYICIISKESLCVIIATESNMLFMFPLLLSLYKRKQYSENRGAITEKQCTFI